MNNRFARVMVSLGAALLMAGCGNKNDDGVHGTSTRRAEAKQRHTEQAETTYERSPYQHQQHQQHADAPHGYRAYGEPMRLEGSDPVPVGKVLANPAAYEGKYVRLTGDVNKVCTKKGCWLEMADSQSGKPLFVKFTCPVNGRLIPMAAVGKNVVVEGTVMVKEISEADAKHLKEESGASPDEVERIKGPQKQITLQAPAARVAGL